MKIGKAGILAGLITVSSCVGLSHKTNSSQNEPAIQQKEILATRNECEIYKGLLSQNENSTIADYNKFVAENKTKTAYDKMVKPLNIRESDLEKLVAQKDGTIVANIIIPEAVQLSDSTVTQKIAKPLLNHNKQSEKMIKKLFSHI